jgi:FAD/FMN-containing dehydrogenase
MSKFSQDVVNQLQMSIRGRVIQPGADGYDESRTIWNAMIDRRPGMVVRCIGTADVIACVNFARTNDIPFTIRGGGHNIAGLAVADDTMMIDLSHMRGAWVNHDQQTVNAQPGATLGDIDRETQIHGLAAVLGFVSNTGATGLTLGGGFGYLTRKYGWTCDNVASIDMVTAEGEVVHANETENADLFWGLRGGGGNFGVVTNIEHRLYPVGPEITGGLIAWRGEDAEGVLEVYSKLIADAPRELTCASLIRKAPPAPWLPPEIHGKQIIGVVCCHTGTAEQAEKDLAVLKNYGSPVGDVVQRRPYTQQQSILDATQPNGRRYYWKSEYFPGLEADSLTAYRKHADAIESPHSAAIFFAIDGALNEQPNDHSPMGNRDAKVVLNLTASWESADEDDTHIGWAREAWTDMRRFSTGGTYVNFLTEDDGEDRIRDAYGDLYDRLVEVKSKWDPNNMFSKNKNIVPQA